jgi:hypothetical protein
MLVVVEPGADQQGCTAGVTEHRGASRLRSGTPTADAVSTERTPARWIANPTRRRNRLTFNRFGRPVRELSARKERGVRGRVEDERPLAAFEDIREGSPTPSGSVGQLPPSSPRGVPPSFTPGGGRLIGAWSIFRLRLWLYPAVPTPSFDPVGVSWDPCRPIFGNSGQAACRFFLLPPANAGSFAQKAMEPLSKGIPKT